VHRGHLGSAGVIEKEMTMIDADVEGSALNAEQAAQCRERADEPSTLRGVALRMAIELFAPKMNDYEFEAENVVKAARVFEAYLRGDTA
jgi:hypothetical protein